VRVRVIERTKERRATPQTRVLPLYRTITKCPKDKERESTITITKCEKGERVMGVEGRAAAEKASSVRMKRTSRTRTIGIGIGIGMRYKKRVRGQ
jgi:hypothetical protein